ncbi:MAG: cell division ATPase MinD [Candidatus Pacearchaeota archaeon]
MNKVLVITSGKGGVGKTTSVINLGIAMTHFGRDILIIDANLSTPNVGIHLNAPHVPISLNHVLRGKAKISEAVYNHESGIKVIPSSISVKEIKRVKLEKIKDFKKEFEKLADYILVDSSAGLGDEAIHTLEIADELIIITNPEMPAIADALKVIKLSEQLKKPIKGVIVTRVRRDDIELAPSVVKEMLEIPVLGMIPEDNLVRESIKIRKPVVHAYPKSSVSRAYKEIAARILGEKYDSKKDKERIIEKLLRKLKMKKY